MIEGLYFQKVEDCFFVAEPVTPSNVKEVYEYLRYEWAIHRALSQNTELESYHTKGIGNPIKLLLEGAFHKTDDEFRMLNNTQQWMMTISFKSPLEEEDFKKRNIELMFLWHTSPHIPITNHIGIFRTPSSYQSGIRHKKPMAMMLHAFAARFTQIVYPDKKWMVTVPMKEMREKFEERLKGEIWFGNDNSPFKIHYDRIHPPSFHMDDWQCAFPKCLAQGEWLRLLTCGLRSNPILPHMTVDISALAKLWNVY